MQTIDQLEVPDLNILDPEFKNDPYRYFGAVQGKHWIAKTPAGFMILGFNEMKEILSMDDKLDTPNRMITELMGAEDTSWGRWNNRFLLARLGDDHKRIRDLVAPTFSPRNANLHRPIMREVVSGLLDEWGPKQHFDFADFASNFPITVMCRLIGAPRDSVPKIKDALEVMGSGFSMNPEILPDLVGAFDYLWNFVVDLFERRGKTSNTDADAKDLLDLLLEATDADGGLTRQELYDLVILLFGAGYDTSKNLLTMIMYIMLGRPDDWERLASDPDFARKVIEETLRYTNVITTYRIAKEAFSYRDVEIPQGTTLIFPLPFAGRDKTVFHEPDQFDPERKPEQRHFGFGRGMHICLGMHIARAQIEEALPIIASRLRSPKLDGEIIWRPFPGIWGLRSLPISFGPNANGA